MLKLWEKLPKRLPKCYQSPKNEKTEMEKIKEEK
jgi:hypothetical protein